MLNKFTGSGAAPLKRGHRQASQAQEAHFRATASARAIIEAETPKKTFKSLPRPGRKMQVGEEVISGTGITRDIFEATLEKLKVLDPKKYDYVLNDEVQAYLNGEDSPDFDPEYELYEHLFAVMRKYCPPFTYFGSLEADGSIGCWPWDSMSLDDAVGEGKLFNVEEFNNPGQAGAIQRGDFTGIAAPYAMIEMPSGSRELWDAKTKELVWKW